MPEGCDAGQLTPARCVLLQAQQAQQFGFSFRR